MTAAKWILHSPKQAGAPQLQLLTPLADGRQQLLWQYELPQAEDEVVLSASTATANLWSPPAPGRSMPVISKPGLG